MLILHTAKMDQIIGQIKSYHKDVITTTSLITEYLSYCDSIKSDLATKIRAMITTSDPTNIIRIESPDGACYYVYENGVTAEPVELYRLNHEIGDLELVAMLTNGQITHIAGGICDATQ